MKINLGSIQMPINAATKSFAGIAKRGAGKTYLGGVLAEEFFKNNIPFVVFDPIDVWWGLRLAANGKDKGLPIVVFGLRHADIPLTRDMGREIARAVVKENISCVISTFGMSKTDMRHIVSEFSEELLHINNTPRHVIIEEAHEFVPQRVQPGAGKCFANVEALVTMGRNQGIGVTMLNQRAATINKDVLTQIDTLLALRSVGPQDRKALAEWVEVHAAPGDFDKFMESLPSLPTGEGWVWSPEFLGVFEKFKIRKRETFHPDREKIGPNFVVPALDAVDVQSFIGKFTAQMAQPKPKKGEKVSKKDLDALRGPAVSFVGAPPVEIGPSFEDQMRTMKNEHESKIMAVQGEVRRWQNVVEQIRKVIEPLGGSVTGSVSMTVQSSGNLDGWVAKLNNGRSQVPGKILAFLGHQRGMKFTRSQLSLGAGVAYNSGTTNSAIALLLRNRLIVDTPEGITLSPDL